MTKSILQRLIRKLALAVFSLVVSVVGVTDTYATTCSEDCHARCRKCVKYDLGLIKDEKCIIEPSCHLSCEAEKKLACSLATPVPAVPRLPSDPLDIPKQLEQTCKAPFEAITHSTIAYCANWGGRADDLHLVEDAKQHLVRLGFAQHNEFAGIDIRWCPIHGSGMAPERGRILLHPNLKNNQRALVKTLGHELVHMRQYARWGSDSFKCRYSQEMGRGHAQDRRNYVEREAYEYEDRIGAAWDRATATNGRLGRNLMQSAIPLPQPPPPISPRCGTPFGACLMNGAFPVGSTCWCPSWQGPVGGTVF